MREPRNHPRNPAASRAATLPAWAAFVASLLAAFGTAGCGGGADAKSAAPPAKPLFAEVAAEVGIQHRHEQPVLDPKLANIMAWMASVGAAVATADIDGDGLLDLYFTNSNKGRPNFLYRNQGDGTFEEIAARAGLAEVNDERGVSMDAIFGDVDNDGDPDLYLVRWGSDSLYLNQGGGSFEEATDKLFRKRDGSPGIDWANGNGAVFFDFDRDGRLDVYVGNYFQEVDLWNLEHTRIMHDHFEQSQNAGRNFLFHQQADGSFLEVAAKLGVDHDGWTLAVGSADVDGDSWPDLYVANDFGADQLYLGGPGGSFDNVTESAIGIDTKKGMNVDFGDVNGDGWLDVYVTNITTAEYLQEGNMLWLNQGPGDRSRIRFADVSLESGTYDGGWGWGSKFFDYDNDGDQDLVSMNGFISAGEGSYWYDLATWTVLEVDVLDAASWPAIGDRSFSGFEKERLWRNEGMTSFTEQSQATGLVTDRDGRGVAVLDYDGDGDLDVAIANQNQPPNFFRNSLAQDPNPPHFLDVRLVTDPKTGVNRDGIGSRVLAKAGETIWIRERDGGNGFAGQSSPILHFGLGAVETLDLVEVRWPDGRFQVLTDVAADQVLTIVQDAARTSVEPRIVLAKPAGTAHAATPQQPVVIAVSPEELERQLADMETRLGKGYDRRLASTYRRRAADHGAVDRAIAFLRTRADQEPTEPWRIELGAAFIDKIPTCGGVASIVCKGTQARKGLDELDRVLQQQPDSWLAYYNRGMNHLHWPRGLLHSDDAAKDLEKCLELQAKTGITEPHHLRAYLALGQAYAKNGQGAEARIAWQKGLAAFPEAQALKDYLAIKDDDALLEKVEEDRSIDNPIDTDLSFYPRKF